MFLEGLHTSRNAKYESDSFRIMLSKFQDKLDPDAFVSSDSEAKEFYSNVCCKNMEESLAMFQNDDLIAQPGKKFRY
ncbi:unnamed protein product [Cylicostephanus goldi]|uniref:Uncharacterized protein n=1 Tax=Cylicostephanus goldi TaxID=71465 RepID=A0A3P7N077_CYLGO|nr:unnamed protein product [Cylicostephanus goldi]